MAAKAKSKDPWPSRTGEPGANFSSQHVGPDPAAGVWSWRPGGWYDTPLLDADGHIYVVMRNTRIQMWRLDLVTSVRSFPLEGVTGTPVLASGVLYAITTGGTAAAFNVKSGAEVWKAKYCAEVAQDPLCLAVKGEVMVATGNPDVRPPGSYAPVMCDTVFGIYTKDGRTIWSYKPGLMLCGFNFTPCIIDDVVLFMNSKADVCCVKLRDGTEKWKAVPTGMSRSFGGVIAAKNGFVYAAVNRPGKRLWNHPSGGKGTVRAYDLKTGEVKWETPFDLETHAVPSLLSTGPGGKTVLVVGLGATPGLPEGNSSGQKPTGDQWEAQIVGLDPETGKQLWITEKDVWAQQGCRGSEQNKDLVINAIAGPVGAGDGTFYAVWQGKLRQYNVADGALKSEYDYRSPVQANPVIGPGVLVVADVMGRTSVFRAQPPAMGKVIRPLDVPLDETGTEHFWCAKHGHDMGNQGFTGKYKAPRSLKKPSSFFKYGNMYSNKPRWQDDNFYHSPVIDSQRNVYVAANFSDLFIVRPDGRLRGAIYVGPLGSTPVLIGRSCYVCDGAGFCNSFDLETLKINWRVKYCESNPWDSWTAAGVEGALIVQGNCDYRTNGATHLYRLNTSDGGIVWKFAYPHAMKGFTEGNGMPYNLMAGISEDGRVVTADNKGGVYCNSFETGDLLWSSDYEPGAQFTTATVTLGRNGMAANAWNRWTPGRWNFTQGGKGKLDVYDISSGSKKWERFYNYDVNVAPLWIPPEAAQGSDGWQVVVCLGSNPGPPAGHPDPVCGDSWKGLMMAQDAETGKEIWSWAPPPTKRFTFRGSDKDDWYLPDAWTSVSSDSSGTIYGSFHDGVMYAVKGGELISQFDMRSCGNCAPGIAPGMVTHMNQHGLLIWRDSDVEEEWAASGDKRAAGGKLPGGAVLEDAACGGPWDDGRLEWLDPMPFSPDAKEKKTAEDIADHEAWLAETVRLEKESLAADLEWSDARRAERAEVIKATSGGPAVWVVVGGTSQGGITVREGEGLKSKDLGRIATGATVEELQLTGDRLQFKKLTGDGPDTGWVSLSFKGTPLVKKQG